MPVVVSAVEDASSDKVGDVPCTSLARIAVLAWPRSNVLRHLCTDGMAVGGSMALRCVALIIACFSLSKGSLMHDCPLPFAFCFKHHG